MQFVPAVRLYGGGATRVVEPRRHRPEKPVAPVDTSYHEKAACEGFDTNLFYPEKGHNHMVAEAKRLCNRCPVVNTCLADALSRDPIHDWGVWGGTTKEERARLRDRKKKVAA